MEDLGDLEHALPGLGYACAVIGGLGFGHWGILSDRRETRLPQKSDPHKPGGDMGEPR
jgi:hypothetical protein